MIFCFNLFHLCSGFDMKNFFIFPPLCFNFCCFMFDTSSVIHLSTNTPTILLVLFFWVTTTESLRSTCQSCNVPRRGIFYRVNAREVILPPFYVLILISPPLVFLLFTNQFQIQEISTVYILITSWDLYCLVPPSHSIL